jgi:hypothetical protein
MISNERIQHNIDLIIEQLMCERDKIYGEFIARYCDDEHGNMIHCYSTAYDQAHANGEFTLCERYSLLEQQIAYLQTVMNHDLFR